MPRRAPALRLLAALLLLAGHVAAAIAQQQRTPLESFFNVASPLELTAASWGGATTQQEHVIRMQHGLRARP
ncbi:MAG TPA: hypothetical protein VFZ69_10140 [Longimicrobiales bacterium]